MFRNKVRLLYPNQNKARKKKDNSPILIKYLQKNKEKSGKKIKRIEKKRKKRRKKGLI